MGFWTQVLGADNFAAAYNAVLMEHALSVLSAEDFVALMERFPRVAASGRPGGQWDADFALEIAKAGRLVELNLLAFTMADLGQVPRLPKELWMSVKNPFACASDTDSNWVKVRRLEADMLAKHGVEINVPRRSLLDQLVESIPD